MRPDMELDGSMHDHTVMHVKNVIMMMIGYG